MTAETPHLQYRVQATLPDATTAVLYATTYSPQSAMKLARWTWNEQGIQPVRLTVRLYPVRQNALPLLEWIEEPF